MATVQNQAIPPSLATQLSKIITIASHPTSTDEIARINPRVFQPEPEEEDGALAYFATETATWLREWWAYSIPETERSTFFAARKADLWNAVFPSTYWHTATLLEDVTELGRPAWVLPSIEDVNPAYFDPAHRPSNCPITTISDAYQTPTDGGTLERPAPGWSGAINDGIFSDTYQAQRRLLFALPIAFDSEDKRPLALRLDCQVTATATIRGNAIWFVVNSKPDLWHTDTPPAGPTNEVHTNWVSAYRQPLMLPADAPEGWSHTHAATYVRNAALRTHIEDQRYYNRAWIRLATPPSRGRYFSRNDAVTVRHTITASLHIAKKRGE